MGIRSDFLDEAIATAFDRTFDEVGRKCPQCASSDGSVPVFGGLPPEFFSGLLAFCHNCTAWWATIQYQHFVDQESAVDKCTRLVPGYRIDSCTYMEGTEQAVFLLKPTLSSRDSHRLIGEPTSKTVWDFVRKDGF